MNEEQKFDLNNESIKTPNNKKNNLIVTFIIIIIATVGFVGGMIVLNKDNLQNTESNLLQTKLEQLSNEFNKKAPYMIDDVTRLDKCEAKENKTIAYYYTIIGIKDEEGKKIFTNEVIEEQKSILIKMAKTSKDLQFFRDNEINLQYIYNSENGTNLATIEIPYTLYK